MPLLPQPDKLEEHLKKILVSKDDRDSAWKSWDWYNDLAAKYPQENQSLYVRQCKELLESGDAEAEDTRSADIAWAAFWEKFGNERRLVLYAQRYWLDLFFSGYNPAAPGQQEDSDRPFDWDHIFPQGYIYNVKKPLLEMWRHDWPHTIGNIRAWPMELNRSYGKTLPAIKMADDAGKDFDPQWKNVLSSGKDIRTASFVGDEMKSNPASSSQPAPTPSSKPAHI